MLTQAGISLRPGRDLAFFHQTDGILYVRACREVLDLIDQFTKTLGPDPWIRTLEVEVMIVGFSQPGLWKELATADDPRTRAENLSAEDGAVLARATVTTRSGQRAFLGQTKPAHMGAPAPSSETTAPEVITTENSGEPNPGLRLEVEPLLGPDNDLMDISFKGAFCLPSASPGATPVSGYFNTALILRSSDCSLQRLSLEGSQWKEAAILFSATIKGLDRTGWKNGQRLPSPREQRWRAFGEKPEAKGP